MVVTTSGMKTVINADGTGPHIYDAWTKKKERAGRMLTASREWHCNCGCDETIKPGERFRIVGGCFYKDGHEQKESGRVYYIVELPVKQLEEEIKKDEQAEQLKLF